MSKKQKNKEKSNENDLILSEKSFAKAQNLYIAAINLSYKLKNVGFFNIFLLNQAKNK